MWPVPFPDTLAGAHSSAGVTAADTVPAADTFAHGLTSFYTASSRRTVAGVMGQEAVLRALGTVWFGLVLEMNV